MKIYQADIFTGKEFINNGFLVIKNNKIIDISKENKFNIKAEQKNIIAPLPINAHTHLDMSNFDFKALPYFLWISDVINNKEKRNVNAVKIGLELINKNCYAFGDIALNEEIAREILKSNKKGTVYLEILNPNPDSAKQTFEEFTKKIKRLQKIKTQTKLGISPHATYTVSSKLMGMLGNFSIQEGLPMQIHVSEHISEIQLFKTGFGDLWDNRFKIAYKEDFAQTIGRQPEESLTPIKYLNDLGILEKKPILVHVTNANKEDYKLIAKNNCFVISCPRSNKNLECGFYNWQTSLEEKIKTAIGTDSIASGENLNIKEEIYFLEKEKNIPREILLDSAIKIAAQAIDLPVPEIKIGDEFNKDLIW